MPRASELAAWLVAATFAVVQTCAPAVPVLAQHPGFTNVAVCETGATVATPGAARALRQALADELGLATGLRLAPVPSARYVVRGSVTRLVQEPADDDVSVRCEVSLLVAEARGGNVRFVLSGRASARGDERDHARLARAALRAAVHGALQPLNQTLLDLR